MRSNLSQTAQLQALAEEYRAETGQVEFTAHDVAVWAVRRGSWRSSTEDMVAQCATRIAKAMREEFFTDSAGRRVRAKHVARVNRDGQQLSLWNDLRTASPEFVALSFTQRRDQIVGDCRQLKSDMDSYNEGCVPGTEIQLTFDFTEDLAEFEALEALTLG